MPSGALPPERAFAADTRNFELRPHRPACRDSRLHGAAAAFAAAIEAAGAAAASGGSADSSGSGCGGGSTATVAALSSNASIGKEMRTKASTTAVGGTLTREAEEQARTERLLQEVARVLATLQAELGSGAEGGAAWEVPRTHYGDEDEDEDQDDRRRGEFSPAWPHEVWSSARSTPATEEGILSAVGGGFDPLEELDLAQTPTMSSQCDSSRSWAKGSQLFLAASIIEPPVRLVHAGHAAKAPEVSIKNGTWQSTLSLEMGRLTERLARLEARVEERLEAESWREAVPPTAVGRIEERLDVLQRLFDDHIAAEARLALRHLPPPAVSPSAERPPAAWEEEVEAQAPHCIPELALLSPLPMPSSAIAPPRTSPPVVVERQTGVAAVEEEHRGTEEEARSAPPPSGRGGSGRCGQPPSDDRGPALGQGGGLCTLPAVQHRSTSSAGSVSSRTDSLGSLHDHFTV
mmetsp:Transcript_109801/g.276192  ORF Transcript_109801/g.276192 Transcript_109801/m.276192 type:complete len:463 (-) Transcript_109801:451-1839(-)